ncbi:MAG TPA: LamG-like jellyroll fold domain-containing protein [Blastocatellia bacterium]|nr:LamG-like jellyroll fold domain-containing protein [Blastocatellia bacterium]
MRILLALAGLAALIAVTATISPLSTRGEASGNALYQSQCVPPPANMVSWWRAEGNPNDSVGTNNGVWVGTPAYATGEVGQAFSFNGSNYVDVPNNTSLEPQTVTVDFWFNSASPGTNAYLLSKGADACNFASYSFNNASDPNGALHFDVLTSNGFFRSPGAVGAFDGTWHHAAGTYDGSQVCLYVDGVLVGCTPATGTLRYALSTTNDLTFGRYNGTCVLPYTGLLDEIEVFSRALSLAEIQSIVAAGSAGKCTVPCTLTCPPNQAAAAAQTCPPGSSSTVVNYPAPTTANCGTATTMCTPPSGSTFPVGTTTVTCTATGTNGATATCSFTVTVFSGCLQDDSNPSNVVLFNAQTGDYRFCCNGTAFTGRGTVSVRGCVVEITHNTADRRVLIKADFSAKTGTASLQTPPGTLRCTITDRNTSNNTCQCGTVGP